MKFSVTNKNLMNAIGHYHFIVAYTSTCEKPMWWKREFFAVANCLVTRRLQILIDYLGSKVWINVNRSELTFSK